MSIADRAETAAPGAAPVVEPARRLPRQRRRWARRPAGGDPAWRPLRIAMIGQKGVPATFGGVERHVEELGARLAARGHEVTVYCRRSYDTERADELRGMRLRYVPAVATKHLDAISHSGLSSLLAMADGHDVVHYHALGPGLVAPLPRYLSRSKVVQTVHGLDHERQKWGRAAQLVLGTAHTMSARVPDRTVVVSQALAEHYATRFGREAVYIPNGVEAPVPAPADEITSRFGLAPGSYALFVGRLVPEKAPDLLVRAFRDVPGDLRLVIAGGSSFTDDYTAELHRLAARDPRVVLTGYVYGRVLQELYTNAAAFVLPSLLEGLPLTLLEAASYGVPVLASDIPPHREVLRDDAPGHRLVPVGDEAALRAALWQLVTARSRARSDALVLRDRVLADYSWSAATDRTERLYLDLVAATRGVPARAGAPTGVLR